jgi:outer membrane protein assembly factor BamB
LPSGNLLIFNNCYAGYGVAGSRVIEFDPRTRQIVWSFGAEPDRSFNSNIRAGQQRLPNGNVLVTESCAGRVFEVNPRGEIVWRYATTVRGGPNGSLTPVVAAVRRIPAAELPFLADQRTEVSSLPVEHHGAPETPEENRP